MDWEQIFYHPNDERSFLLRQSQRNLAALSSYTNYLRKMSVTVSNNSKRDLKVLEELIEKFAPFAKERMGYDQPVSISLISDEQNSLNPLGRTAYYDPKSSEISVYVDGRHPKDMMRSISHELVHHTQNCRGDLNNIGSTDAGYAQEDGHLRKMEEEAYRVGNLTFRDFEDNVKKQLEETIYKGKGSISSMNKEQLTKMILETIAKKLAEIEENKGKETALEETNTEETETLEEEEEIEEGGTAARPENKGKGQERRMDLVAEEATTEEVVEEAAEETTEEVVEEKEPTALNEWWDRSLYDRLSSKWAK